MNRPADTSYDVSTWLPMLRRQWRVLLYVPLLAALATGAFFAIKGPSYTASANLLVIPGTSPGADPTNTIAAGNLLAQTYAELIVSPPVLDEVITSLHLSLTEQQLTARVRVVVPANTQILTVQATDKSPAAAAQLTNAVGTAFVVWLTDVQNQRAPSDTAPVLAALTDARTSMDRLAAQEDAIRAKPAPLSASDQQQLTQLETSRQEYLTAYNALFAVQQRVASLADPSRDQVQLVSPAQVPQRSTGLPVIVAVVLAGVLAFMVMAAFIVVKGQADRRAESFQDVRQAVDVPVLATIPDLPTSAQLVSMAEPDSPTSEAIRILRLRLLAATGKQGIGTVAFTGAEEEHPAIAANLAISLAQSGQRVVLVDTHLRQPLLSDLFQSPCTLGLADLLGTKQWPDELLPLLFLTDSAVPGLRLLLVGSSPATTSELLQQPQLERILSSLRTIADAVVIDAPPLLRSADGLLSALAADHSVVMVEAGQTHLDALQASVETLRQSHADVLGIVFSGAGKGQSGLPAKRVAAEGRGSRMPLLPRKLGKGKRWRWANADGR